MKNNLPYFSHDNNARGHPKMKALIAEFGYEGYGRFWALNERIAESDGAFYDISKKINKLALAKELDYDNEGLTKFLNFLSDPEIGIININEGLITTDRVTGLYQEIMRKREMARERKEKNKKPDTIITPKPEINVDTEFIKIEPIQFIKPVEPEPDRPSETKEDATKTFNKAMTLWNELKIAPSCRNIIIPPVHYDCLTTFQNYTWIEIENAIRNYHFHTTEADEDWKPPPPYGSIYGFLKTGVPRYYDDEECKQQFKGVGNGSEKRYHRRN